MVKSNRVPIAILDELMEEGYSDEEEFRKRMKKTNYFVSGGEIDTDEYKDTEHFLNREDVKGSLTEWLSQPHVKRYIHRVFNNMIKNLKDEEGVLIYESKIVEMSSNNRQSLEVDYNHINQYNRFLAKWLLDKPKMVLEILNQAAFALTCEIFPNYANIFTDIFVRIKNIPVMDTIRSLRHDNLDTLIKLKGTVTKRTNVLPYLKKIVFYCMKCGEEKGPFYYSGAEDLDIGSCLICQAKGPWKINNTDTTYRNYQKVVIQESPGTVPPGRVPCQKEIILNDDLVDSVRPGEEIELVGIYVSRFDLTTNVKHSFPIFSTYIEANYVGKINELEVNELTDEDKFEIRKLSKNPNITNLIFNSIAPSIYGHDFIKKSLALAMFGGESKDIQGKHRIRGDINVLLLGDPGMAKSQFLKYTQKVFHRSVYTTGKGASAVGLTAAVHKDPVTKEWTLEGGALVLADKGICLIDEFDKMNDQDRTSIHEAMEQQTISISKAGIVTTLQARCSVIAAANPINGRYNNQNTFADNVNLTEPILSRFDILCVVKDEIDPKLDSALSTFVINSHISSHLNFSEDMDIRDALLPDEFTTNKDIIPQDLLRKYIMYARKYIHPKNSDLNKNKVAKFYAELRKESELVGGMTIAVRHLESLLRIAEAHAKICLREYVRPEDIDFSIKMMLDSFFMSQKASIVKNLRRNFKNYLTAQEDTYRLLLNLLDKQARLNVSILNYHLILFSTPI